ncbi:MAG: type II toxin-antitoxin system VapC family toxin [Spirochaetales bacterium]|nr:type II toxin-antitoxin system VapC family toxin [Spirochaetales bacterium]
MKRYLDEKGSKEISEYFIKADTIWVSYLNELESLSTIRRLLEEKRMTQEDYNSFREEIDKDYLDFFKVEYSQVIQEKTKDIIDRYQLKTLDAIHLAACLSIKKNIDAFVCCDKKLANAAKKEKLKVLNPLG